MMEIKIDLNKVTNKQNLLQAIGQGLGYKDENSWGMNWDALSDILEYLDRGGIYGTNKIISTPVTLTFENYHEFKLHNSNDFNILVNILNENKKENPDFNYKL